MIVNKNRNGMHFLQKIHPYICRIGCLLGGVLYMLWSMPFLESLTPHFRSEPLGMPARWIMFGGGFTAVVYGIFGNFSKKEKDKSTICPNCERVFLEGEKPDNHICSNCNVELEALEGFYDRHPELKDDDEESPEKMEDIK